MNRELKFRLWNGVEWLGVDEFTLWDLEHPHKGHTFQQFTGLKDKNGKDIYEGDIVKFGYTENKEIFVGEIVYFEDRATFGVKSKNARENFEDLAYHMQFFEVIGNIFENKDLLCDHTKYHMSVNGNCYNCGKLIFPKK